MTDPTAVVGRRTAAYAVDGFVIFVSAWTSRALLTATLGKGAVEGWVGTAPVYVFPGLLLVLLQGLTGVTPGKRLVQLRTVREDGRVPGIPRALVRSILLIGAFELPWGWLPLVGVALVTRGHRRVGDMVARTYVVDAAYAGVPNDPPEPPWVSWIRERLHDRFGVRGEDVVDHPLPRMAAGTAAVALVTWIVAGFFASTVWTDFTYPWLWRWTEPEGQVAEFHHDDRITSVAFSPDGRVLTTASRDGTVRLWDTRSHEDIAVLDHDGDVVGAVFSPDGALLATASGETVRVWDAQTHEPLVELPHDLQVDALAFSSDGELLATAVGAVALWDTETFEELEVSPPLIPADGPLAFSPDGALLAAPSVGGFRLWDTRTYEEILGTGREGIVASLAFSPDGTMLATADISYAQMWDVETGEPVISLQPGSPGGAFSFEAVAFSPDGKLLATAGGSSQSHRVLLWDLDGYELVATRSARQTSGRTVRALAFSPDGSMLASGDGDGRVSVWSTDLG